MGQKSLNILRKKLDKENYKKLSRIKNPCLHQFIAKFIELLNPARVIIFTDSKKDLEYIRDAAIRNNEEFKLATEGHTVHFDSFYDQGRDRANTRILLPEGMDLGPDINSMEREKGIAEIYDILKNIMEGRELYVKFFCLGPEKSKFSILCVQITDSSYVAHSENLLYRQGYREFVRLGEKAVFFKFVHSQGELVEAGLNLKVSKNTDKRRVYIDLEDETIYSANTQYGGNTIGLKKLAMRLAIKRASGEGWLTEHMLIMGIRGPKNRVSYFTGAFPSMCGKTATAMVEGEAIIGDDIAYLKKIDGEVRAVNVEKGMFGIIEGISSVNDPLQWKALKTPGEVIFSNVLVTDKGRVCWNGSDEKCPEKGVNYSGEWFKGKKDKDNKDIPPSHKNARFTLELKKLDNLNSKLNDPEGVRISAIVYGGRDSDTWSPVEEAFCWEHGIIMKGASLESETTAATLGSEGIREFNPMSNLDFLSITIGKYIRDNLGFGKGLKNPPKIFSVNYFLKDRYGQFMNHINDKRIWLKWMEGRVHGELKIIETPTGFIPWYQDLRALFKKVLNKGYPEKDYIAQFTIRIPENLAKLKRIEIIYREKVKDTPEILFEVLAEQKKRLEKAREKFGNYINPAKLNKNRDCPIFCERRIG